MSCYFGERGQLTFGNAIIMLLFINSRVIIMFVVLLSVIFS